MIIAVLDYGAGNLKNVCRAIEHLGYDYKLVSSATELLAVDKLVIPGVGAFKVAMEQLHSLNLVEPIKQMAQQGVPILGICLGMQLLFERSSEFGLSEGLGLLKGSVELLPSVGLSGEKLKVPHIGWNELTVDVAGALIAEGVEVDDAVYYVHSYRVVDYEHSDLIAHSLYDGLLIPGIVRKGNVIGCQFHPEKSAELGLNIFNNFLRTNK